MINIRKSVDRGHFDYGWLNTYHTFSFNTYYHPNHMGFRSLRVINEDVVAPGQGFDKHPHENMEIITYIVDGELAHEDSGGHSSVIKKDDVQIMSAGKGVVHAEFNNSKNPVHLLQIWIMPNKMNTNMKYQDKTLKQEKNKLVLIADSKDIAQDAIIYACNLESDKSVKYELQKDRGLWIQLIKGTLKVNDTTLKSGDGASIEHETHLTMNAESDSEFLMFDMK